MGYKGLTSDEHKRVAKIAQRKNQLFDETLNELISWCWCYDCFEDVLNDYEDSLDIQDFEKKNNVKVLEYKVNA